MEILLSTDDVHPRDRFDYWHAVACRNIVLHDCQPESRATFHAALEAGTVGDVELVQFDNAPMTVRRTPRHLPNESADHVFVCRQVAGTLCLEQLGRDVVLSPGDVTLLDPARPYAGRFISASRTLVAKVPRWRLQARLGAVEKLLLCPVRPCAAERSLASSFLGLLPPLCGDLGDIAQELVRDQLIDLLGLAVGRAARLAGPQLSTPASLTLARVRSVIEARLTDPELTPAVIARACGLSVRYINALLAKEQSSIGRLIRHMRLERCRRALRDPHQAHRRISEIAYAWGFADATHFGRLFRAAFGASPSDYRERSRSSDYT